MLIIPFKCRTWVLDSFQSTLYDYSVTMTGLTEFLRALFPGNKDVQLEVEHLQVRTRAIGKGGNVKESHLEVQ